MSRTSKNFSLTGRAASQELSDQREFLREVQDPRSSFWQGKANDALIRLQGVVGDEEGKRQVENIEGTYRSICEAISLIADLAEQQALERRLAQLDGTYPSPIISGGDIVEIIPQAGDDDIPF